MADEPAPAEAPLAADKPPTSAAPAKAPSPAQPTSAGPDDGKAARLSEIIRNGFTNTALSRDPVAWASFETRLPDVVAAILEEV